MGAYRFSCKAKTPGLFWESHKCLETYKEMTAVKALQFSKINQLHHSPLGLVRPDDLFRANDIRIVVVFHCYPILCVRPSSFDVSYSYFRIILQLESTLLYQLGTRLVTGL